MQIEQFVMAYRVEQDRLRALLPEGFVSLRPVLRINAEIRDGTAGYLECNTAAAHGGKRGWLNIAHWADVPFTRTGSSVRFHPDFLTITFTPVGVAGGCPAEGDNDGCFFLGERPVLRPPERITVHKEFCDCRFSWHFAPGNAHGESTGETLPTCPTEAVRFYPKESCTIEHAAAIPCIQVLGTYTVGFQREEAPSK